MAGGGADRAGRGAAALPGGPGVFAGHFSVDRELLVSGLALCHPCSCVSVDESAGAITPQNEQHAVFRGGSFRSTAPPGAADDLEPVCWEGWSRYPSYSWPCWPGTLTV